MKKQFKELDLKANSQETNENYILKNVICIKTVRHKSNKRKFELSQKK